MTLAHNKSLVLDFYKQVIGERNSSLVEKFISRDYVQHSPQVADGIAGLKAALAQMAALPPAPAANGGPVKLVLADGDFVVLMLELTLNGQDLRVLDVFRLADGRIAEHWDASQDKNQPALAVAGTLKRVFRENDTVVLQSRGSWQEDTYACYDIYQLRDNTVQEHIRVQQKIPAALPHANGMI